MYFCLPGECNFPVVEIFLTSIRKILLYSYLRYGTICNFMGEIFKLQDIKNDTISCLLHGDMQTTSSCVSITYYTGLHLASLLRRETLNV